MQDAALAVDPKSVEAMVLKGRSLLAQAKSSGKPEDFTAARGWFNKANRIDPEDPEPLIWFYRSFLEQKAPPTANAIAALTYASDLAPQDMALRLIAARLYLGQGKIAEAKRRLDPLGASAMPIRALADFVLLHPEIALVVTYGGPFGENYWYQTTDVHGDKKINRFTPHNIIDAKTRRRRWFHPEEYTFPLVAKSAAKIARAGGRVRLRLVWRLAAIVAVQTSLERVLNWGREQRPPIDIESILTQDEYTHDVLIPFEGRYLVYDTT